MTMPSGTSVSAKYACYSEGDCYLEVVLYALAEDAGRSEGLCGNYNGRTDDDRRPRGSDVDDDSSEPIAFAASYMSVIVIQGGPKNWHTLFCTP